MATLEKGKFLTKEQLAGLLGVSLTTIDRRVKDGTLKPIRFGKLIRFDISAVNAQSV